MNSNLNRNTPESEHVPRIDINKTVTNDICLFLNTLAPTKDIARLIRHYDDFMLEYLAEIRLLNQIVNKRPELSESALKIETGSVINEAIKQTTRIINWLTDKGSLLR